jgi:arginyl-tRNA synthetase
MADQLQADLDSQLDPAEQLAAAISAELGARLGEQLGLEQALVRESSPEHNCDYQSNAALAYAKRLGLPPRQLAEQLLGDLSVEQLVASAEVAGPGFINFRLRNDALCRLAGARLADPQLGVRRDPGLGLCVVDYSSPNVAKEMHVGHLRSTVIGDALVRMLLAKGEQVLPQNHLGDWGTPFGMLIELLADRGESAQGSGIADLDAFYKEAHRRFTTDPSFAERARRRVVELQQGDPQTRSLWEQLVAESERHFTAVYNRLGVLLKPEHSHGESAYQPYLEEVARELEELGLARESEGALCAFPVGFTGRDGGPMPLIIRKSDGGYSYDATDLAALRYRVRDLGAKRILYVVGAPQRLHFELVFAVAREAGWLEGVEAVHVAFGSVLGEDRKMLRTRSGDPVRLTELLDEAVARAAAVLEEKGFSGDPELAKAIGIGAVKYADLSADREHDYVFSFARMLALDGNTSVYLQYANARARAVLRRAGLEELVAPLLEADGKRFAEQRPFELPEPFAGPIVIEEEAERALCLALIRFPAALRAALADYKPHRLCTYLHSLGVAFSTFYERCPILEAPQPLRDSRLALTLLVSRTLTFGLSLLGIAAPARLSAPPRAGKGKP